MFGENPSEAAVYKPLAIYEPIDEHYLDFLYNLKVEIIDKNVAGCFFEVDSTAELDDGSSLLVLLSKENLLRCQNTFRGSLGSEENKFLSFKLSNLKHKIRVYHHDARLSFRYFINNFFDAQEMSSNYILIKKGKDYTDIIVPTYS